MDRRTYRENAFKLLFEQGFKKEEDAQALYLSFLQENDIADDKYLSKVFFGVINDTDALDEIITNNLKKTWNISRLSKVSLTILRLGTFEMKECDDIPFVVSINEAVELSKKYDDESSPKFVNGVLNSIASQLGLK